MTLTTSISALGTAEDSEVICKICRRQFSRYTCPKCNLLYCSLTCFRSETHSQCSETFYRKEIESDIRSEPSKSTQERHKMMDLLKRFEEQAAEEDDLYESSEEGEDEDTASLARRLKGIDLEHASPDALWELLTHAEQDKFIKALDNPSSELAQQLLAHEQLERGKQEPWWDAPSLPDEGSSQTQKNFGAMPSMTPIPAKMMQSRPDSLCLVYNVAAVFVSYAYVTRSLSVSPLACLVTEDADYKEAQRIVSQLVSFLVDRKSKILHPSLSAAVTDTWSRFDPGKMTTQFFALLLCDAAHLLRPSNVLVLPPRTQSGAAQELSSVLYLSEEFLVSHPSSTALLALSDLSILFQNIRRDQSKEGSSTGRNHIQHKLLFYAAYILSTPSPVLKAVADELLIRSKKVEGESLEVPA